MRKSLRKSMTAITIMTLMTISICGCKRVTNKDYEEVRQILKEKYGDGYTVLDLQYSSNFLDSGSSGEMYWGRGEETETGLIFTIDNDYQTGRLWADDYLGRKYEEDIINEYLRIFDKYDLDIYERYKLETGTNLWVKPAPSEIHTYDEYIHGGYTEADITIKHVTDEIVDKAYECAKELYENGYSFCIWLETDDGRHTNIYHSLDYYKQGKELESLDEVKRHLNKE